MIMMLAVLAALPPMHLPACGGYDVPPAAMDRRADAARVGRTVHRLTDAAAIGTVMATADWRIVWAQPADSEPGVFFFHRVDGRLRFVDVWSGVTSDRDGAFRWASGKVGAPTAMAHCFAARLIDQGP